LKQIGLLTDETLPVFGAETATKLLELRGRGKSTSAGH
jgi:hypothetical protein